MHSATGFRLYKKGDKKELNNWRTRWLINVVVRLLGKVISARLQQHAEHNGIFGATQYGFRAGHSTLGPIMIIRMLAEMASCIRPVRREDIDQILVMLLDIERAYPSIAPKPADQVLERMGVPNRLREIVWGGCTDYQYIRCDQQRVSQENL